MPKVVKYWLTSSGKGDMSWWGEMVPAPVYDDVGVCCPRTCCCCWCDSLTTRDVIASCCWTCADTYVTTSLMSTETGALIAKFCVYMNIHVRSSDGKLICAKKGKEETYGWNIPQKCIQLIPTCINKFYVHVHHSTYQLLWRRRGVRLLLLLSAVGNLCIMRRRWRCHMLACSLRHVTGSAVLLRMRATACHLRLVRCEFWSKHSGTKS